MTKLDLTAAARHSATRPVAPCRCNAAPDHNAVGVRCRCVCHDVDRLIAETKAESVDPLIEAIVDLEVAEDEYAAAEFAYEQQRSLPRTAVGHDHRFTAYLDRARRVQKVAVDQAATRVGIEIDAAWPSSDAEAYAAVGRWVVSR